MITPPTFAERRAALATAILAMTPAAVTDRRDEVAGAAENLADLCRQFAEFAGELLDRIDAARPDGGIAIKAGGRDYSAGQFLAAVLSDAASDNIPDEATILAGYGGGSARGYSPLTYRDVRDL